MLASKLQQFLANLVVSWQPGTRPAPRGLNELAVRIPFSSLVLLAV